MHVDNGLRSRSRLLNPLTTAHMYHHCLPFGSSTKPAKYEQQGACRQSAVSQSPEQSMFVRALITATAILSPGPGTSFSQHFLSEFHSTFLSWHLNSVKCRHFLIEYSLVHFRSLLVCNYLFLLSQMYTSFSCFLLF